jgi:cation:H+ antiporter
MTIFGHIALFLLSFAVIWFFAGILVDSVDRVAKRFNHSGFTVAFFVLGFLTSVSEISVAVNSSLEKQPQISAGNLVGASFVIILLIVPLLAILGKGISLKNTLSRRNLLISMGVVLLPALFLLDGVINRTEAVLILLLYGCLIYSIQRKESLLKTLEKVDKSLLHKKRATLKDSIKILIGAAFIFAAGYILVNEAVYFSETLSVPSSLIGLILLSVGTNFPELVIAFRSIVKKHKDIAFGDYLGSAVANTPVFAILVLVNGAFTVESSEFVGTFFLMLGGLILFYIFAGSRNTISRFEGWVLMYVYLAFLLLQISNLARFAEV